MTTSHKPVIGLLGGPGAGKSHVAWQFARLGAAVIDADQLAHEVLDEPAVVETLQQWWGKSVVDSQGRANRRVIGQIAFEDPSALKRLESLVHPRVGARRQELRERFQADPTVRAIVEDGPLLIEKGLDADCDVLVMVDTPRAVRLERLGRTRGWEDSELARREKLQTSLDIKRQRADHVIVNGESGVSGTQAEQIFAEILQQF